MSEIDPKHLQDADPAAWQRDKKPEPSEEQTRLFRACAELIAAKAALADHDGPYSGRAWLGKTERHRGAWAAFEAVFTEIKGSAA